MDETKSGTEAVPMKKKYILCKYRENNIHEITLVKISEFYTEQRALECAAAFSKNNPERVVMLTELVAPASHWG